MDKTLVCYFSATGTTREVALKISDVIKADVFEIEATDKYTSADLDWTNKSSRSSVEMADESSRPSIKNKVNNVSDYNNIVIGFPVWWYREPSIIDTFIEENDLSNKNVYVFVTSGGSTVNGSFDSLKKKYPSINFISGKRLGLNVSEDEILNWINN